MDLQREGRIKFLNTEIDNITFDEALNRIQQMIESGKTHYLVTPNVDHIIKLEEDQEFGVLYKNADLVLIDGMILIWISKLLGRPIKEKISGSDLFPRLCELSAKKGYKVFLLGAAEGVAKTAADNLKAKYEGLNIVGTYSPSFGFEKKPDEIEKIINMVRESRPDILAVGLGAPKQEKFIYKYKDQLGVPMSIAIGASIDFEAGNVKRAPRWMQESGLEWFYRLCSEPRRLFKRYLVDDIKIFKIILKYRG